MYSLAAPALERVDLEMDESPIRKEVVDRKEVVVRKEFPETWIWEFVDNNGCDIFI